MYEITYLSKEPIARGRCLECHQHFINTKPEPGDPLTGCGLTGEFLPDDWDTDVKPWDRCPVLQCRERGEPVGD